jgi:anti-sigma28 factor (negative regulator of flagellin synthesis)
LRINNGNTAGAAAETAGAQNLQKSGQSSGASSGNLDPNSDQVEFSSTLGRLSRAVANDSTQQQSRVQAMAAQYQSGRYQPDSMAIGRAMIADAVNAEPM